MNETVFDKEMKDMLHRCADELHAPDKLKTRVDFALKNGSSRPRRRWGRRLIALAAVAAITVTEGPLRKNERMSSLMLFCTFASARPLISGKQTSQPCSVPSD